MQESNYRGIENERAFDAKENKFKDYITAIELARAKGICRALSNDAAGNFKSFQLLHNARGKNFFARLQSSNNPFC